jgi:hypothetical protein
VTLTHPVIAVVGTLATICESDQLDTAAFTPLKETELVPCVVPKPLPLNWTCVPTGPLDGAVLVICGAAKAIEVKSNRTTIQLTL